MRLFPPFLAPADHFSTDSVVGRRSRCAKDKISSPDSNPEVKQGSARPSFSWLARSSSTTLLTFDFHKPCPTITLHTIFESIQMEPTRANTEK